MIAVRDAEYRPLFMHGILLDVTEPVAGRSSYANAA